MVLYVTDAIGCVYGPFVTVGVGVLTLYHCSHRTKVTTNTTPASHNSNPITYTNLHRGHSAHL